jgi:hypothetical protein
MSKGERNVWLCLRGVYGNPEHPQHNRLKHVTLCWQVFLFRVYGDITDRMFLAMNDRTKLHRPAGINPELPWYPLNTEGAKQRAQWIDTMLSHYPQPTTKQTYAKNNRKN